MSYSVSSKRGLYMGFYSVVLLGSKRGDTRSLGYGSNGVKKRVDFAVSLLVSCHTCCGNTMLHPHKPPRPSIEI